MSLDFSFLPVIVDLQHLRMSFRTCQNIGMSLFDRGRTLFSFSEVP